MIQKQREKFLCSSREKSNNNANLDLRRVLSKISFQYKTQNSIFQLDIRNNENTFYIRNTLTITQETTSERD